MTTILSWATSPAAVTSSYSLAIDSTYLYVGGVSTTTINRILLSNPASYTANFISTGYNYLISICSDNTYIYTGHGTGYVDRWNKSTGALANISGHFATGLDGLMSIATDGVYLFISSHSKSLIQVALSAPTVTVATYPFFANRPMFAANGYFYIYTGNGDIYQITPTTYAYTKIMNINMNSNNYATGMVVVGDYMYLAEDTKIFQIYLPSKTVNTNWATGFTTTSLSATDGTYIYTPSWTTHVVSRTAIPISNLPYPCFRIDTRILTNRGYRKVQHLRKGDLVKTFRNGFVPIHAIGTSEISHSANDEDVGQRRRGCWLSNRLFRLTTEKYPELTEDLILTGYHSVLVDEFHGIEKTETRGLLGDIYITDGFYRLPACIDRRASVYEESGRHRIYHLALENDNYYGNYGIYANGLLVESCCKRYLLELSNMKLLT